MIFKNKHKFGNVHFANGKIHLLPIKRSTVIFKHILLQIKLICRQKKTFQTFNLKGPLDYLLFECTFATASFFFFFISIMNTAETADANTTTTPRTTAVLIRSVWL